MTTYSMSIHKYMTTSQLFTSYFLPIHLGKEDIRVFCKIKKDKLPFRIKFIGVQVPGYGPSSAPAIGIAIIGFNDYIL